MKKISTSQAPAAICPYSQAVCLGRAVFTSGQIPVVPETGVVPEGIEAQTVQSLENAKTILEGTGSDLDHVVKTTIFLADIADFGKVNEIYAKYFANEVPARSCVEVARLPKDVLIEIEAIAAK